MDISPQPLTLSKSSITSLQQWLVGQFESGWQLHSQSQPQLNPQISPQISPQLNPYFRSPTQPVLTEAALVNTIRHSDNDEQRWQAAEQLWTINPTHPESPVLRTKDLGLYLLGHSIDLLVGVLAKPHQQRLILIRLLPTGEKPYLPPNLTLMGQDGANVTVFSIQSRQQDDCIQFKFTAAVGDRFQLCIKWNEAIVTEHFIV